MSSTTHDLLGVWVGNGGAEATLAHSGNRIEVATWGGAGNPSLRRTSTLAGGLAEYDGTWQNQDGDFHGAGAIHFKVIDANVIWVSAEGIVMHAGAQAAWKDSGNMVRKPALTASA
jgi:hypothetical protein